MTLFVADAIPSGSAGQAPFARTTFLLLFLVSVAALGPSLFTPFIQDDFGVIVRNEDLTLANLPYMAGRTYWDKELPFEDPWRPGHYVYRPLPVMMFTVEKSIFGLNAWGFRLSNLILHILCAFFVATLAARILGGSQVAWQAGRVAGLLFAVHAVHFETVLHIVGRAELGMTAATLAALLCVDKAAADNRWMVAAVVSGMVATLFKEQGLLCPLLVLSYAALCENSWPKPRLLLYTTTALLWSTAYLIVRNYAIRGYSPSEGIILPLEDFPFLERAAIMATALVEYLRLFLLPVDPLLDYHHLVSTSPKTFAALSPITGVLIASACVAAFVWGILRNRLDALLGAGLIMVGLGPVSNLFFPIGAVIAERFLYLPSAGACILIAGLLKGRMRLKPIIGLVAAALTFMIFLCWHHTYYFQNPLRVAFRIVARHPDAPGLLNMAALTFERYGRLQEARAAWARQKQVDPEDEDVDIHLARLALREIVAERNEFLSPDETELAETLREHLDRLKPLGNRREAPLVRGRIHYLFKEFDSARMDFLQAALSGRRRLSDKREAARALLEMEKRNLGSTALSEELMAELRALLGE